MERSALTLRALRHKARRVTVCSYKSGMQEDGDGSKMLVFAKEKGQRVAEIASFYESLWGKPGTKCTALEQLWGFERQLFVWVLAIF